MPMLYRKRLKNQKSVKTAISLRPDTVAGINRIREVFAAKYPTASHPTLSFVLDAVIAQSLERLSDPAELDAEVADFERRYPKKEQV